MQHAMVHRYRLACVSLPFHFLNGDGTICFHGSRASPGSSVQGFTVIECQPQLRHNWHLKRQSVPRPDNDTSGVQGFAIWLAETCECCSGNQCKHQPVRLTSCCCFVMLFHSSLLKLVDIVSTCSHKTQRQGNYHTVLILLQSITFPMLFVWHCSHLLYWSQSYSHFG